MRDIFSHIPWRSASAAWMLLCFSIAALVIVLPLRLFIAQPFIVAGASMAPTFDVHEYLVVDELSYRFQKPTRGDVIIFQYPLDPDVFFVKRIVGLPGERVTLENGAIVIGGGESARILDEPYAMGAMRDDMAPVQLGEHEYFVLGDNRAASADSRVWGPLQDSYIIGRAFARLYPFERAMLFPGKHVFDTRE